MIEYIKGEIVELTPANAVVENNSIGYLLQISLNTYAAISGSKSCKLYVHEAIREDAYNLYGFSDKSERDLFLLLISVSGVGANTARIILSSLTVPEIKSAIMSDNFNALKSVKGIGAKTAQRIIVDLKDKVKFAEGDDVVEARMPQHNQTADEAVAALVMLGFNQAASQKAVSRITKDNPLAAVEEVIKSALKML